MANLYDTDYFRNWKNQNINNQNINNTGSFDYRNALGDNWALPYVPQDINTPLRDNIPFKPDQGNIPYVPPEKKGFSFNPLNWGVMGLMKRMVEPNTPEENFGRGYFNTDSAGRTYGNQAHDVFAGKNVVSAYGKGMGAAGQKRIDRINQTLSDWEAKAAEGDEEAIQRLKNTGLKRRRDEFKKQLAQYNKDLAAGTGGADIKGPVITKTTSGSIGDGPTRRDTSGWSSPGYSTRGGFTGTGGSPGTGQRGHHGNWAQGGRIGLKWGGDPDEPAENIFEFMQDQGVNYDQMAEGVDQKFLSDELGAIDVDEETLAMISDLLGRETDVSTISTLTGKDEGTIERVIRVLTTQSRAQGGRIGYKDAGPVGIEDLLGGLSEAELEELLITMSGKPQGIARLL